MEQKFDYSKVYLPHPDMNGEYKEYLGGPNFIDGLRTCPNCSHKMVRMPLNTTYKKVKGGKIIVYTDWERGIMKLTSGETDYIWGCESCVCSITHGKRAG